VLAYLFWHRPRASVATGHYEDLLRAFHETLAAHAPGGFASSHVWRLAATPWLGGGAGYEDWYLVEDWTAVGVLNDAAVAGVRRPPHDAAAAAAGAGTAGVYRRLLGAPRPTGALAAWFDAPAAEVGEVLAQRLGAVDASLWRRQLVLGPTPEYCLLTDEPVDLDPWPATVVAREPVR
jgi:hypothetical protein